MTYYTRASDEQRNDAELKAAIAQELEIHRQDLLKVVELMREAYTILCKTPQVDESSYTSYQRPSGQHQARVNLYSDSERLEWMANFLGEVGDTYYGNKAAFMLPEQAQALKEKYHGSRMDPK